VAQQFNALPQYELPLHRGEKITTPWYTHFANTFTGKPPDAESTVAVTPSPMTYTVQQKGFLIVQGGTVSLIQFSRGLVANHTTGQTQGCFPLSQGDSLIITYSAAPNLTWVPQ
jgi:hypothetical protein